MASISRSPKQGFRVASVACLLLLSSQYSSAFLPLSTQQIFSSSAQQKPLLFATRLRRRDSSNYKPRNQPRRRQNDYYDDGRDDEFVLREFEDYGDDFDFDLEEDDDEPPTFDMDNSDETSNNSNNVGAHFFSQKPLEDPSFVFEPDQDVFDRLCDGAGITRPSRIQSLSWPVILNGKHTIVADQTGSGKFIGYLKTSLGNVDYTHQP